MQNEVHLLSILRIRTAKDLACLLHCISRLNDSSDGTTRDRFIVLLSVRQGKGRTIPVASIDSIETRAGVKDLQNPPSSLFTSGLALWLGIWFSWRIQAFDTTAVECFYPLPDTGQWPFHSLGDLLWREVPVFQDGDRLLPEVLVLGLSPLRENLSIFDAD